MSVGVHNSTPIRRLSDLEYGALVDAVAYYEVELEDRDDDRGRIAALNRAWRKVADSQRRWGR